MTISVTFIKKKNGFLYLIQDYQNLNVLTMKNKYLILLITKLIIKLQGI